MCHFQTHESKTYSVEEVSV